ncbi:DUF2087 domain-containing protein [Nonomuraea typhae]|uniref:DUF2087 domain-containing protein n=1 Tax=Nonomuraea typhae TaxID=2603600 RepID=UPI0015E204C3|nr:DUF2087 domain-containing protein [Nonomuraea typhae]
MSDENVKRVLGLLAQDDTLRAFSALVLGGAGDAAPKALEKLRAGGLAVRDDEGRWQARPERFRELLKALAEPPAQVSDEEKVLRAFLVEGRLKSMPMKHEKRMVVLRYITQVFEPGVRYPEKEVNVALRAFHDDYAALRRYLIDADLLSREDNVYWRSGGPVSL